MLIKLDYSVTFPTTGRSFSETVLFEGGFGAIVGPNESGKSLILEMIRFCLYGSAALRGQADDYKTLKAGLLFRVRDVDYVVERTNTKAKLMIGDEVIATGIKPVNLKIVQILGFGLEVFDMSCVANQNELTKLGELRPTERQRRVDSVIGVAVLDDLAKRAGDEATLYRRSADDMAASAVEPQAPVQPDGYVPVAELEEKVKELDQLRSEADQIRGWLATEMQEPSRPIEKITMESSFIQDLLDQQNERRAHRQALEAELARIPAAPDVAEAELQADEAQHELARAFRARRQFLLHNTKPQYTLEQLDQMREDFNAHSRYLQLKHLETQRDDLLSRGEHTCPSCNHHWPIASEQLESVEKVIELMRNDPLLETPPVLSWEQIEQQTRITEAWDEAEWQRHASAPETEPVTRWSLDEIAKIRIGLSNKERREEIQDELSRTQTKEEPDYAAMLRERQQYEAKLSVWTNEMDRYAAWQAEKQQKMLKLTMLEVDLQCYDGLSQKLSQSRVYEQALAIYDNQLEAYNRVAAQVAAYRADADDWSKVKEALKILRLKIKQHLVPSLNRVASTLISQMTGGQRQQILVDEEFNISVDGQAIDTLSGSGMAVANLALRIGLGQVLTNNVFSLFMGDEIDASMDKNRAEKTSQVLYTLKGHISQLLLVSHKFPAADYYIAVGDQLGPDILSN